MLSQLPLTSSDDINNRIPQRSNAVSAATSVAIDAMIQKILYDMPGPATEIGLLVARMRAVRSTEMAQEGGLHV